MVLDVETELGAPAIFTGHFEGKKIMLIKSGLKTIIVITAIISFILPLGVTQAAWGQGFPEGSAPVVVEEASGEVSPYNLLLLTLLPIRIFFNSQSDSGELRSQIPQTRLACCVLKNDDGQLLVRNINVEGKKPLNGTAVFED